MLKPNLKNEQSLVILLQILKSELGVVIEGHGKSLEYRLNKLIWGSLQTFCKGKFINDKLQQNWELLVYHALHVFENAN